MSIEKFFAFARERHAIYLRRAAGLPRPWTEDPALALYYFTNVFRELDRTTVWFRENVRERLREQPEVLLATVLFRWFNRITTGEAIFKQTGIQAQDGSTTLVATAWDCHRGSKAKNWTPVLKHAIRTYCGEGPYVTGAFIVKTPDGLSKLDGVLECLEQFMLQEHECHGFEPLGELGWQELAEVLAADNTWDDPAARAATLEGVWNWLRQFPFMGDFMAYEVVTDLRHTALLDRAPDIMTWANPGPGAARGIGRLLDQDPGRYSQHSDKAYLIGVMQSLLEHSQQARYWPQPCLGDAREFVGYMDECEYDRRWQHEGAWPAWEMRDVEHTLCEFDKYCRAAEGGKMKRVYRG